MKGFIVRFSIFMGILAASLSLLSIRQRVSLNEDSYLAAIVDKHARLESLEGPRLIFVGDSNIAFGLDCEMIEKGTGIETVNMGLHGGLGLEFPVNEIRDDVRPGDVIVLCFTWMIEEGSYRLKSEMTKFYPRAREFYKRNFKTDVYGFFSETRAGIEENIQGIISGDLFKKITAGKRDSEEPAKYSYTRSGFNAYGDEVAHLDRPSLFDPSGDTQVMQYSYFKEIAFLNEFKDFAGRKGARVFFAYPCYPDSYYRLNESVISRHHADLLRDMDIPILGDPDDFLYDESMFFDTCFHLGREARGLRSLKLISLINAAL